MTSGLTAGTICTFDVESMENQRAASSSPSDTLRVNMESVSLSKLTEQVVDITRLRTGEHGRVVVASIPQQALMLFVDPEGMRDMLAELLQAIAASASENVPLSLSAHEDNGRLHILLQAGDADIHGKSMRLPLPPHVDESMLSRARSFIGLQGGTLEARAGSSGTPEFLLTLPCSASQTDVHGTHVTTADSSETSASGCNILIADDNVDAAESLGELLNAFGHQVHIVHDGQNALDEASRLRPDVVILDIGLPAMDGYEVARRLRADANLATALLLAVTGYAQERDRIDAQQAGFDHHLAKPIDIARLTSLLDRRH